MCVFARIDCIMTNRLTIFCMLIAIFFGNLIPTQAGVRTAQEAQQIAAGYLSDKHIKRMAPVQGEWKTTVVFDALDKEENPYLYAIRMANQEGFVIISGDDRYAPVLGYSLSSYDEQDMPANMRAWLQGYIDEMEYLNRIGYQPSKTATRTAASDKQSIAPMVETLWGQGSPYNNLCPVDNSGNRSVTGCVATAMAQLMNYHIQHYNAPTTTAQEIPEYTTSTDKLVVAAISENTALPDKSLLLNTYGSSATEAQKEAVAKLMLYCGTSVKMNYTSSSSGATTSNVSGALVKYFGFDKTTISIFRFDMTYAQWVDTIYNELLHARPVVLGGHSSGGGHAFVADGYDSESNFFHINWGWTGKSNDYFALSVLNPDDNGQIGASSSGDGYSYDQVAIVGAQIGTGQQPAPEPIRLTMNLLSVNEDTVFFSARNYTGETRSFQYGIGWINNEGQITRINNYLTANNLQNTYGWSSRYMVVPENIDYANTTKMIIPISREKGTDTWFPSTNISLHYVIAIYDANGVPSLTLHPLRNLQGGEITINSSKYVNEVQTVKMPLINNGDEFYGLLYLFASTTGEKGDYATKLGITALESSQQTLAFEWKPKETGTYNIWVATDLDGNKVLSSSSVTIKEDASLAGKTVAVTGLTLSGLDKDSWQFNETTGIRTVDVYCDSLYGTVQITNLTTNDIPSYKVRVQYELYDEQAQTYTTAATSNYTSLNTVYAGKTRNLSVNKKLEPNNIYRVHLIRTNPTPSEDLDIRYYIHLKSSKKSLQSADVTHTAIPDQPYSGSAITPVIVVKDGETDITDQCTISYANNINAGSATVTIDAKASSSKYIGSISTMFNITKVNAEITAAPQAIEGLVYDGTPKTLVVAGTAIGGVMLYSLDNNVWSGALPQAVDAGDYMVYYRVEADKNHIDHSGASLSVTIAEPTPPDPPSSVEITEDQSEKTNGKFLKAGHLFIKHNDRLYNASGARME